MIVREISAGRLREVVQEVIDRVGESAIFMPNEVSNLAVYDADRVFWGYVDVTEDRMEWVDQ